MLAFTASPIRQDRLWLPVVALPTVLGVDNRRSVFKRAFASTLVVLRADSGIGSQRETAKQVGTSEATYRRWENLEDPALPDAYEINRLCEVLGCEPGELTKPEALSDREVRLARRAGRAGRRGLDRGLADDPSPS